METKNKTEVLEGNSLDSFFTDTPPTEQPTETEKGTIDDLFDPPKKEEEEKPEPKKEEPAPPPVNNTFDYSNIIQEFVEDGDWEDVDVEMEVDGELQKIPITELKNVTPEIFKQLKQSQKELREADFNSKYISTENLDENTLKMVELKKAGGDISELIKAEAQMVNPLKGMDLDDERVQEYLVREKYRHQNIDQDMIDFKVKKLKENLQLDTEAKKVSEEINQNFTNLVDSQKKQQEDLIRAEQERRKEFKKTTKQSFQDLKLDDKWVKPLVDMTSNFDENGLTDVDKAFFEAKKNPKLFAKVAFMLHNENAFNEFMGVKVKNDANLGAVKKVLNLYSKSTTTPTAQKKEKAQGLDALFEEK